MKSTLDNLNFITVGCRETCQHFAKQNSGLPQFLSLNLLERLGSTTIALKALLENVTDNNNLALEHSCGILLRSSFLDGLVAYNLYKKTLLDNQNGENSSDEDEKNVNKFCNEILSDGLFHTLKYYKNQKQQNLISEKELACRYKEIVEHKKDFFEPYNDNEIEPKLKYDKYYSPIELFQMLSKDTEMKNISQIYESYFILF